jgi:hypothetical protein
MNRESTLPAMPGHSADDKASPAPERGDAQQPAASDLALPHERDEVPAGQAGDRSAPGGPREVIDQAARDIRRGLVDTERRGVPSDVPGPGRDPEHSEGAVVPPEGVDRTRDRRPKRKGTAG